MLIGSPRDVTAGWTAPNGLGDHKIAALVNIRRFRGLGDNRLAARDDTWDTLRWSNHRSRELQDHSNAAPGSCRGGRGDPGLASLRKRLRGQLAEHWLCGRGEHKLAAVRRQLVAQRQTLTMHPLHHEVNHAKVQITKAASGPMA